MTAILMTSTGGLTAPVAAGDSVAKALGHLFVLLLELALLLWLLSTGIPKWMGPPKFMMARRNFWFVLLGLGILAVLLIGLVSQNIVIQLLPLLYAWGWTWISWIIADRRERRRFETSLTATPTTPSPSAG